MYLFNFNQMFHLFTPSKAHYPQLLAVWESSVRATHHFLQPADISFFKKTIQEKEVFSQVTLIAVQDENNRLLGFAGISGNRLEMLFIDAAERGKGLGKNLMLHVINNCNVTKVDVNEQNAAAVNFYKHFGFKIISRDEIDGTGKPYPILHMER